MKYRSPAFTVFRGLYAELLKTPSVLLELYTVECYRLSEIKGKPLPTSASDRSFVGILPCAVILECSGSIAVIDRSRRSQLGINADIRQVRAFGMKKNSKIRYKKSKSDNHRNDFFVF